MLIYFSASLENIYWMLKFVIIAILFLAKQFLFRVAFTLWRQTSNQQSYFIAGATDLSVPGAPGHHDEVAGSEVVVAPARHGLTHGHAGLAEVNCQLGDDVLVNTVTL